MVAHLIELRDRVLRVLLSIMLVFLALFAFRNDLYTLVAEPLIQKLPEGTSMIATEVASPFLAPVKLTLWLAVFITMPVTLYHIWTFVMPGLYRHERSIVLPLLASSTFLFLLGMIFAYYAVFPLVFAFFTATGPEEIAIMTDINRYLSFVMTMFFAFGVAFEVPIAVVLLVLAGAITPESLADKRRYVIVGAFVIGMALTPPDMFSQTLLALPMWLLFELGVFFSRIYVKKGLVRSSSGS